MSMEYIRRTYNVPAKRGGSVKFTDRNGKQWIGKIKSAAGHRLRVCFPDFPRARAIMHPTWNIEYLDGEE